MVGVWHHQQNQKAKKLMRLKSFGKKSKTGGTQNEQTSFK